MLWILNIINAIADRIITDRTIAWIGARQTDAEDMSYWDLEGAINLIESVHDVVSGITSIVNDDQCLNRLFDADSDNAELYESLCSERRIA